MGMAMREGPGNAYLSLPPFWLAHLVVLRRRCLFGGRAIRAMRPCQIDCVRCGPRALPPLLTQGLQRRKRVLYRRGNAC